MWQRDVELLCYCAATSRQQPAASIGGAHRLHLPSIIFCMEEGGRREVRMIFTRDLAVVRILRGSLVRNTVCVVCMHGEMLSTHDDGRVLFQRQRSSTITT